MVRFLSNSLRRGALRCVPGIRGQSLLSQRPAIFRLEHKRTIHDEPSQPTEPQSDIKTLESAGLEWDTYKTYFEEIPLATSWTQFTAGKDVTVHGFIEKRKDMSSNLSFCYINLNNINAQFNTSVQIVSSWKEEGSIQYQAHLDLKNVPAYSPVVVTGTLQESQRKNPNALHQGGQHWDLKLRSIRCLNPFPKDIIVSKDAVWPPKSRHLQMRFDPLLRDRLRFRSAVESTFAKVLRSNRFIQVETPILFKSTPEGAREFLVPTRRQGYAYALPQSPQQYKQILMAGGIPRYFQFAKCFRDEDHRADRQPEFTQLDLEMAFAEGKDVMHIVQMLVESVFRVLRSDYITVDVNGTKHPVHIGSHGTTKGTFVSPYKIDFKHLSYDNAMKLFGSDKPDLRIQLPYVTHIYPMRKLNTNQEFIKMITSLGKPIVEAFRLRLGLPPKDAGNFIRKFMDGLPSSTIKLTPGCTPAVFVYDSSKPLNGLAALGHQGAESVEAMPDGSWTTLEDGDIIIMQARPDAPFYGGSTDLGRLRTALHEAGVKQGLVPRNHEFQFVWVSSFPLFTPAGADDGPGQGGAAGFSATHHPFTAPLAREDFDLLRTDPLRARACHYDLVVNGVEVGGGSRRIHVAAVQEYVLRDILRMSDEGVAEFAHLLEALRAGCPPHAGFAFGFDRLLSVILDVPSVKDVIAFPKSNRGEDLLVGSPAKITPEQQKTYHIFAES